MHMIITTERKTALINESSEISWMVVMESCTLVSCSYAIIYNLHVTLHVYFIFDQC